MSSAIDHVKKQVYGLYHRYSDKKSVVSAANLAYDAIEKARNPYRRSADRHRAESVYTKNYDRAIELNRLKVAFLCDDFTYTTLAPECRSAFITPCNWFRVMEKMRPDVFFCESAWYGIGKYHNCWKNKVAYNPKLLFENRRELFRILDYCHRHGIKTVFWNKEDPAYFETENFSFSDTAIRFDYIFTTCQECIERYRALGHKHVYLMMFSFSPRLFNPIGSREKERRAVFAGSWYAHHPERCEDMEKLLDMVLDHRIPLEILDRNYGSSNELYFFPEKYRPYIYGSLPFEELGARLKNVEFAININTVTDSQTMFARRVFEMMASNISLISNESPGMRRLFGDRIWYSGEPMPFTDTEAVRRANLEDVFEHHTTACRLKEMCRDIGIRISSAPRPLMVIYRQNGKRIQIPDRPDAVHALYDNGALTDLSTGKPVKLPDSGYVILADPERLASFAYAPLEIHFSYLEPGTGIAPATPEHADRLYEICENSENQNVLFPVSEAEKLLTKDSPVLRKYYF